MKQIVTIGIGLWAALTASIAGAGPLTPEEKASDLRQIASLLKSQYGPYDLKKTSLKLDLDALVERYSRQAAPLANIDFYYLLNRFAAEFKDSHLQSKLATQFVTTLGFTTDRVEGRALIDTIDMRYLPPAFFPFRPGDEVVALNGVPTEKVVEELAQYISAGSTATRLRAATLLLGHRPAALVPPQYGKVKITLKSFPTEKLETVEIPWRDNGEPFEEGAAPWNEAPAHRTDYLKLGIDELVADLPRTERAFLCSGATRIRPPQGAKFLLGRPFVAYYHPTPKGNIGYLRIPHYEWKGEAELRFKQYEWVIQQLEEKTVALVIDQDHNCGGNVKFLERMVSLFAQAPFDGLKFRFLSTRSEYFEFRSWLSAEERASTIEGERFSGVLDLIKTFWAKGERMTPPITMNGTQKVLPNPIRYTKPVLILIDEMSGSAGDAFPALLQGMGRAKLFGTATMGAGGHVVAAGPLYYSGNKLTITKSLFFHPNGTPIENHGAKPDVPYTMTREDFLEGYVHYQAAYLAEVKKLLAAEEAKKQVPAL